MPRHRFRNAPECDTLTCPRTQHLPPSSVNARRSHSTDRILDVINDYKLSPMPFIPYALTLSLSVAYRKWRFSRLPMFRTRGGADFKKVLGPLQKMGAIWSSARINGQLGQAVMLKLDRNEIMNRKRTKKTAGSTRTRRGDDNQELAAQGANTPPASSERPGTPPNAPSSPHRPVQLPQSNGTETATINNSSLGPPPTYRAALHSAAASSLPTQPPPPSFPLTWTATWTADTAPSNNNIPPPNLPQQPTLPPGYDYAPTDDAIPLPGDLLSQQAGLDETSPLTGVSEGNLEDFLADDDALFRSWDPRFAQSVDFSFSSILDPGNPFAWPEYCTDYMS